MNSAEEFDRFHDSHSETCGSRYRTGARVCWLAMPTVPLLIGGCLPKARSVTKTLRWPTPAALRRADVSLGRVTVEVILPTGIHVGLANSRAPPNFAISARNGSHMRGSLRLSCSVGYRQSMRSAHELRGARSPRRTYVNVGRDSDTGSPCSAHT
jgi:hypothetical protein